MKSNLYSMMILVAFFSSCAQKRYVKQDYPFFDPNFVLPSNTLLRTDGVYVLKKIKTDENGGTEKEPKEQKFYKFYRGGQSNLILDLEHQLKNSTDYAHALIADYEARKLHPKATLFEGYYKLQDSRIIIQNYVTPRKQFTHYYGYIEKDKLIIVKAHEGNGKFEDQNFTDYYKEYYFFVPLKDAKIEEIIPYW